MFRCDYFFNTQANGTCRATSVMYDQGSVCRQVPTADVWVRLPRNMAIALAQAFAAAAFPGLFVRLQPFTINHPPQLRPQHASTDEFATVCYIHDPQLDCNHVSRRRHYALRHRLRPRNTRSRPRLRVRTVCPPSPRPRSIAFASSPIIALDPLPICNPRSRACRDCQLACAAPFPRSYACA